MKLTKKMQKDKRFISVYKDYSIPHFYSLSTPEEKSKIKEFDKESDMKKFIKKIHDKKGKINVYDIKNRKYISKDFFG